MSKKLKIVIILAIVAIVIGVLIYANNKKKSAARLAATSKPKGLMDRVKAGEIKVKDIKMANKDIVKNVVPLEETTV